MNSIPETKLPSMEYRNLTQKEISQLQAAGCEAEDWGNVLTSAEAVDHIKRVRFSGTVRFGQFGREFEFPGGLRKHAGIHDATLHNVTVGDDCLIENISNYIANYEIGHDTVLENVDLVLTDGPCRFGNGVSVSVLNETGGREVLIYDRLTAQIAYVMAMYRHRPELVKALDRMVEEYAKSQESTVGRIGSHVFIRNTRYLNSVRIGDYAVISGVNRLRNGSVHSNQSAPTQIGHGVIADNFIICSGSHLTDNATFTNCFIGQACHFKRRGLRDLRRSFHGDASQVDAPDCRQLLLHECGQRFQPVQPHVQAGTDPSRYPGARRKDFVRFLHPVAFPRGRFLVGDGAACEPF